MLFTRLPKITDTMFDVDGFKIGHGIFLDEIEEHANHKLYILNFNQEVVKRLFEEYQATKNLVDEGDPFTMTRKEYLDILENIVRKTDQTEGSP